MKKCVFPESFWFHSLELHLFLNDHRMSFSSLVLRSIGLDRASSALGVQAADDLSRERSTSIITWAHSSKPPPFIHPYWVWKTLTEASHQGNACRSCGAGLPGAQGAELLESKIILKPLDWMSSALLGSTCTFLGPVAPVPCYCFPREWECLSYGLSPLSLEALTCFDFTTAGGICLRVTHTLSFTGVLVLYYPTFYDGVNITVTINYSQVADGASELNF